MEVGEGAGFNQAAILLASQVLDKKRRLRKAVFSSR